MVPRPQVQVSNISKRYRLGEHAPSTIREAFEQAWLKICRREGSRLPIDSDTVWDGAKASELWALKDISFDVPQGQILGIIGKNGSGKSTLLKVLSRITEPSSGEALIRGKVSSLLEIGTGFHPDLTGRENVFLNGTMIGMRRREILAKFDEIVAFSELERFIDTPVKRYSSGMYVRLAFAIAAHLDAEVLIVDEVLAVGDAAFQKRCLAKSHALASNGRTVLFVSHDMSAIERLCSRVLLLSGGRIHAEGAPAEVIPLYLA